MPHLRPTLTLTPTEYELAVKELLDASGLPLQEYESDHLQRLVGTDGEYVIDIAATFTALGASFKVLVECKHERRPVERQAVQVLKAKLDSTGSQKGMLFSIAGFQRGAIEYAAIHGIALVQLADGTTTWHTRSAGEATPAPRWLNLPKFVGWWQHGNVITAISVNNPKYVLQALGVSQNAV